MAKIDDEHIISIDGKPYVRYAGLLEAAHRAGLKDLQVRLIQSPTRDNGYTAVCEATPVIKTRSREKVYVEIGDANPASIGDSRLSVHAIRIAATRAKARALRDALRISICSVEELALGIPQPGVSNARASAQAQPQSQDKATEAQLRVLRIQADKLGLPEEDYARFELMSKRYHQRVQSPTEQVLGWLAAGSIPFMAGEAMTISPFAYSIRDREERGV